MLAHRSGTHGSHHDAPLAGEVYQTSTIGALIDGVYDGDGMIGELLTHGDFGLGTFNHLDGEMLILDGLCYHLRADGISVASYHLHFIDQGHTRGGHALGHRLDRGQIEISSRSEPHLSLSNGPRLNTPFIPLAAACILAWGTLGGPNEGASMNPARTFGPDLAIRNLSTWWIYLIGPVADAVTAVGVAYVLRQPAKVQDGRSRRRDTP